VRCLGIIDALRQSPAVLTRDGRGVCVLVHPRTWNYLGRSLQQSTRGRSTWADRASRVRGWPCGV